MTKYAISHSLECWNKRYCLYLVQILPKFAPYVVQPLFYNEPIQFPNLDIHLQDEVFQMNWKFVGEISVWDKAEAALEAALKQSGVSYEINPEDGAFYGFNKDLNVDPEAFNFDPMLGIQKKVTVPDWIQTYINDYQNYATPFLVIEPRE